MVHVCRLYSTVYMYVGCTVVVHVCTCRLYSSGTCMYNVGCTVVVHVCRLYSMYMFVGCRTQSRTPSLPPCTRIQPIYHHPPHPSSHALPNHNQTSYCIALESCYAMCIGRSPAQVVPHVHRRDHVIALMEELTYLSYIKTRFTVLQ